MLKLVYGYFNIKSRGIFDLEINFDDEHQFKFNNNKLEYKRHAKKLECENFYGDKINSIKLLVGRNGIGKSTILHAIANDISLNVTDYYFVIYSENDLFYIYGKNIDYKKICNDNISISGNPNCFEIIFCDYSLINNATILNASKFLYENKISKILESNPKNINFSLEILPFINDNQFNLYKNKNVEYIKDLELSNLTIDYFIANLYETIIYKIYTRFGKNYKDYYRAMACMYEIDFDYDINKRVLNLKEYLKLITYNCFNNYYFYDSIVYFGNSLPGISAIVGHCQKGVSQ